MPQVLAARAQPTRVGPQMRFSNARHTARHFLCLAALPALAPATQAAPKSFLLRGGTVVDGGGAEPRRADVRVRGFRIERVGKLRPIEGEAVVDARGLTIAPGFIDAHSHADGGLLDSPTAATQIRQGITTAIIGQDGGSQIPLADYFARVAKQKVALNLASFVGHGSVRGKILGEDYKRHATKEEIARMTAIVESEMKAGALGLSSGLEYDPGLYASTSEVVSLARVASRFGGIYISHVRDEENAVFPSIHEALRIGREAGLPVQISHIKMGSRPVWGRAGEVLQVLAAARKQGVDASADVYPYTFWRSSITLLIPHRRWEDRAAWKRGLEEVGGGGQVLLSTYTPNADWQGKTIAQIEKQTGRDAVSLIQEIVAQTHGPNAKEGAREGVVVSAMSEADVRRFVRDPRVMFCSDGGLASAHPRGAGTYPRLLGQYVREKHVLSLQEAIRKASGLPAKRFGLHGRGLIRVGAAADLVLFDAKTVRDAATVENPQAPPIGIRHVLVNGQFVLRDGRETGARPGRMLRRAARS